MSTSIKRRCFMIGGNNVNGASNRDKMSSILKYALTFDLYCIQDHKLDIDPLQGDPSSPGSSNTRQWKGLHFFLKGRASASGLMILVPPSSRARDLVYHPPPEHPLLSGRYQRLDFNLGGEAYSLHNFYAPADKSDRIAFFSLLYDLGLLYVSNRINIATGDANCCLSPFDRTGGGYRDGGAEHFRALLTAGLLVDAWRYDRAPRTVDFTRWNPQGPTHEASGARLDVFLVSASALNRQPKIHSEILEPAPYFTDHLPILLTIPTPTEPRILSVSRFHFNVSILNDPEAVSMLHNQISNSSATILAAADHEEAMKHWIELKTAVETISRKAEARMNKAKLEELATLRRRSKVAKEALLHALDSFSPSAGDLEEIADVKFKELHWLETTKEFQRQARELQSSRIQVQDVLDHCLGGRPTTHYHNLVRQPHSPTFIESILPPEATATTPVSQAASWSERGSEVKILRSFADFYSADSPFGIFKERPTEDSAAQRLLGSIRRRIPQASPMEADRKISKTEVLKALRASPLGKIPGDDGLTYEFYRSFWEVIGDAYVHVFNLAYLSDDPAPLSEALLGLITLIYKGKGKTRELIGSYRPICLLGCDVKLLSSVLFNRLKGPVNHIVHILQGAFIPGRDISANIQYFYGMLDHLKSQGHPIWNLLLDFEMAFDSVDRDRFYECLQFYGFDNTIVDVRWFKLFLQGTSLQVLVNGFPTDRFPSRRGFPQGLSLSTFMWLLEANKLHSRANQLVVEGRWIRPTIQEVSLTSIPAHLNSQLLTLADGSGRCLPPFAMFADDTDLIELEETLENNVLVIEELLEDMEKGTGVKPNLGKLEASPYAGDVNPAANTGKFKKVLDQSNKPRHLGLPTNSSIAERQQEAFGKYPGAFIGVWAGWANIFPCLLERVHIIRACLISKLVYQLRHLALSKKQEKAIQRTLHQKLTHSNRPEEPKTILPRQEVIALHSSEGGLGAAMTWACGPSLRTKTLVSFFSPGCHPWRIPFWIEIERIIKPLFNSVAAIFTAPDLLLQLFSNEPRLLPLVKEWAEVQAFRHVDISSQSILSVLAEPVHGNRKICCRSGQPLRLTLLHSPAAKQWTNLRNIRDAALTRNLLDRETLSDLDLILGALPQPWLSIVTDPAPPPLGHWLVVEDDDGYPQVICVDPAHPPCLFRVEPSGALHPLTTPPTASHLASQRSAHVFLPPDYKPETNPAHQEGLYFLGEWTTVPFDIMVWSLGGTQPIIFTESSDIKWRICQIKALGKVPGYIPRLGLRPPTWEHGSPIASYPPHLLDPGSASGLSHPSQSYAGLAKLEMDWRTPPPAAPSLSFSQRNDLILSNYPHWVRNPAHQTPRKHVMDRVAARQAASPSPPPPPPPPSCRDDSVDVLQVAAGGGDKTMHQEPWRRLNESDLPLSHHSLGWSLLHGVLPCNAFIAHRHRKQPGEEGGCGGCNQLETLSHVFISCSRVKDAMEWLLKVWFKISGNRPPLDPRVLLVDDQRLWTPGSSKEEQQLWQRLRLSVLYSIWVARCSRTGVYASAVDGDISAAAIKLAQEEIKSAIHRDFTRTRLKEAMAEAAISNVDSSGRDLSLSMDDFKAKWTANGILCSVLILPNGSASLQVQDPDDWSQ